MIKSVLEETGFIDFVSRSPLNKQDFIDAILQAPNVKENYYTILSDKEKMDKLIEYVQSDEYFNQLLKNKSRFYFFLSHHTDLFLLFFVSQQIGRDNRSGF